MYKFNLFVCVWLLSLFIVIVLSTAFSLTFHACFELTETQLNLIETVQTWTGTPANQLLEAGHITNGDTGEGFPSTYICRQVTLERVFFLLFIYLFNFIYLFKCLSVSTEAT